MSLLKLFIPKGYPTNRGDRLKADRRLRYLLFYHCPISMSRQGLALLQHLPLQQEVMYNSFSYYVMFLFVFGF